MTASLLLPWHSAGKLQLSSALALLALLRSLGEWAENLLNDGLDFILLVLGEAGHEVLNAGAENGSILGTHIKDHDGLALGQVIVAQACDQTADGEAIIGDRVLGEGVGRCAQIFKHLS